MKEIFFVIGITEGNVRYEPIALFVRDSFTKQKQSYLAGFSEKRNGRVYQTFFSFHVPT